MMTSIKKFNWNLIVFLFLVIILGLFKFNFHELWKDEWQAWFVATDTSLTELFSILAIEGHPPLWYFVERIWFSVFNFLLPTVLEEHLIQSLHFLLTLLAFWIFFLRFHLHVLLKLGLSLGYFLFFEYGTVNRGYILVIILVFLLAVLACDLKQHIWKYAACLMLLCLTEVYGVFMAVAFAVYGIWEMRQGVESIFKKAIIIWGGALVFGVIIFFWILHIGEVNGQAQANTLHQFSNFQSEYLLHAFQAIFVNAFWLGTVDTVHKGLSMLGLILSVVILLGLIMTFKGNRKALVAYLIFLLGMYFFTALFYVGGPRQWGMNLVFYIAILNVVVTRKDSFLPNRWGMILLVSIIFFQAHHNFRIMKEEHRMLYSNSILAGRFIRKNIPVQTPVFAINQYYATPVIGYAGRKFRSFPNGEPFSYFIWRSKMYIPSIRDIVDMKKLKNIQELCILSNRPLDLNNYPGLKNIKTFDKRNIRNENYYIYLY